MTSATSPSTAAPAEGSVALAVVPGDGIGPEVTAEALKVLEAAAPAGVKFEQTRYDLGAERYLATHEVLPDSVLAEIREHDAILLGAVGGKPNDPNLPPGILERGLLLRLRFELDHYVNLRPSRIYPGAVSPLSTAVLGKGEVDFVVVREGTEGPYTGNGGALRVGTPAEIATEVSVNTAYGVERVIRDAAPGWPRWSSSSAPLRIAAVGSATSWPAMSGADPCTGSNIDGAVRSGLTLPEAARPMPPVIAAARSVTMSPNRLSVTITSNRCGSVARKIITASTWQ